MESDHRYYQRRAAAERAAANRAMTPQGRDRRVELARSYEMKAARSVDTEGLTLNA